MVDNNDMRIPYVSKEVVKYLRDHYALQHLLHDTKHEASSNDERIGFMMGVTNVIDFLEAIVREQEGET